MDQKKHTVLVIEDSDLNREILCEILHDTYNVYSAENGAVGMELLRKYKLDIDIILLDIQMPVMNGYEVLKAVYKDSIFKDIPIVVMTSAEAPDEELRCLNLGASDFLRKPYNPTLIHLRLNSIIRLRESMLANRQQKLFINNITHEIRTPLNAIMGFSQLLAMSDDYIEPEDKNTYCQLIINNTKILVWMIQDALVLSDVENGQIRTEKTVTCINSVCRELMDSAKDLCPSGVKFYFTTDVNDSFSVLTDGNHIQHLLMNLVSNACKFTTQGEIRVNCSNTEFPGVLTISVTDTGCGIPEDKAEYIFEPYTKLDAFKQGNGLGLNIARILANLIGAKLSLDLLYKNGARFLLQLPIAGASQAQEGGEYYL